MAASFYKRQMVEPKKAVVRPGRDNPAGTSINSVKSDKICRAREVLEVQINVFQKRQRNNYERRKEKVLWQEIMYDCTTQR